MSWTARVRFPGVQIFSLLHSVQTVPGAHSVYLVGTRGAFSRSKQGHEADHSPPSIAVVKKSGAIPPLPHTSSWQCLNN
jgi:hypothetical protein